MNIRRRPLEYRALALTGALVLPAPIYPSLAADLPRIEQPLEEVVVTATRRPVPLQRVPLGLSVLTSEEIARSGARNFRDYANAIAGVNFSDVGLADAKVTIRGISTDVYSEIRPLTATYLDEVPLTHPGTTPIVQADGNPELVDVERVEVLRGPQGTLYGASSMGGTIRIVTRKPDPLDAGAYAQTILSSTDHGGANYEVDFVGNLPVSDDGAVRFVGYYREADGYIDNIGTHDENANSAVVLGSRLSFAQRVTERLDVLASLSYQSLEAGGINQQNIELPHYQQLTYVNQPFEDEWTIPSLQVTYAFEKVQLLSSTAWVDRRWRAIGDVTGFNAALDLGTTVPITSDHTQEVDEFFQEFRLMSTGDQRFDWLIGLFFQNRNQTWLISFPAPGFDEQSGGAAAAEGAPDNISIGRDNTDFRQIALFGEIGIPLGHQFRVDLGGRWYSFEESGGGTSIGILGGDGPYVGPRSDESGFVPKLTISWQATNSSLVYATASQGFRPGGPIGEISEELCGDDLAEIGLTNAPNSFTSDILWNYELGARTTLFEGRLQASMAVYHLDWTDIQLFAFLECGVGFMVNGSGAESNGAELEFTALLTDSMEIAFGGAYIDADLTRAAPSVGAPAGSPMPGVALVSWHGSLIQRFSIGANRELFARVAMRSVDETYGSFVPQGAGRLMAPPYEIFDLRIGIETPAWSVSLFAENLLDEYGIVNAVDDFGLAPAGDWNNIIRPRTIGIDLRVNFD